MLAGKQRTREKGLDPSSMVEMLAELHRLRLGWLRLLVSFSVLLAACEPQSSTADEPLISLIAGDAEALNLDMSLSRPEQRLNTVRPNRITTAGGTRITLIGQLFDDGTRVYLDGVECIEVNVETPNRLSCQTPLRDQDGASILVIEWPDGHRERHPDLVSYYTPLSVESISPNRVSGAASNTILVSGTGFVPDMTARLDGIIITPQINSETQLRCNLPRLEPGRYDFFLATADQTVRVPDGLTVVSDIALNRVVPSVGTTEGMERVRLSGHGLSPQSEVFFGDAPAEVLDARADGTALFVKSPSVSDAGLVNIRVANESGESILTDAYLYANSQQTLTQVTGLLPERHPTTGGDGFWIGGSGFDDQTRVQIDEQLWAGCTVQTSYRIFCDPGPRLPGQVSVDVIQEGNMLSPSLSVEFYDEVLVYGITPDRGLVSGGTLVEIQGQGFYADIGVKLDDLDVALLSVTPDRILGLTPPGAAGRADLVIEKAGIVSVTPDMYQYLDTGASFGGAYGGALTRNLNVSVFDNQTRRGVSGASVRVESVGDGRVWLGRANDSGQVVIADLNLGVPVNISVGHPDYTSTSMERVVVENVSLLISKKEMENGSGSGESEPLVTIIGTVAGISDQQKPEEGGLVSLAFVETTHRNPGARFSTPTPTLSSILLEDGSFELTALPGQFGVVVSMGFVPLEAWVDFQEERINYWAFRRTLMPRAMGYTPFLSGYPGDLLENVLVQVNRPMTESTNIVLDNPPSGEPQAPNQFIARAILDLGADGYFDLGLEQESEMPQMILNGLPQVSDWPESHVRMRWEGEAILIPDENTKGNRFSWSSITTSEVEHLIRIGPFLPTTEVITPEFEGIATLPFAVEWIEHQGADGTQDQEVADLHYINLSNQDGLLWTSWIPGALRRVSPPLDQSPLSGQLSAENDFYLSIFSALVEPPFSFDDFTFADLGRMRAYSWSASRFADYEAVSNGEAD